MIPLEIRTVILLVIPACCNSSRNSYWDVFWDFSSNFLCDASRISSWYFNRSFFFMYSSVNSFKKFLNFSGDFCGNLTRNYWWNLWRAFFRNFTKDLPKSSYRDSLRIFNWGSLRFLGGFVQRFLKSDHQCVPIYGADDFLLIFVLIVTGQMAK